MAMRHISMPKTLVTVATVAVALALAVGINAQLNLPTFVVGITNTTTTPAVGTTAQGVRQSRMRRAPCARRAQQRARHNVRLLP